MTRVKVSSVDVTLKLGTVVSKFLPIDNGSVIIMSGYRGSFVVDENLYRHISSELTKIGIDPNSEMNPDNIHGTNFRPMVCKLYASITKEILQNIPVTDRIVDVHYVGYDGEVYEYDVKHESFI